MGTPVTRFGASIDTDLLDRFDELAAQKGYTNRSELLRDLMREYIVQNEPSLDDKEAIGTITLVFNHGVGDLNDKLTDIQHTYHGNIVSTLHVHLDAHNCLEVIIVRGTGSSLQAIADSLISARGVLHGKLVITSLKEMLT